MNENFIEEDWERISMREKAEIAAEIEALMQEEWFLWCEQQDKLPAEVKIKTEKNGKRIKKLTKDTKRE